MRYIRERYILFGLVCMLLYSLYRLCHPSCSLFYDHLYLYIVLYYIWFLCFCDSFFTMSYSRLCEYDSRLSLDYRYVLFDGDVTHVYVRCDGDLDYYELDYEYCDLDLSRDGLNVVECFISNNSTVGLLVDTMSRYQYKFEIFDKHKFFGFLMFLLISLYVYFDLSFNFI